MKTRQRCGAAFTLCCLLGAASGCEESPGGAASNAAPTTAPPTATAGLDAAAIYRAMPATLGEPLLKATDLGENADAMLLQHAAHIDQIVEATKAPTCDFGIDYSGGPTTLLPHLAVQRRLARLLKADAVRLLAAGDKDGAARRVAALLRMASQIGGSAQTSIEMLVAMAISELGAGLVQDNPAIAGAAWKTDIQHAAADYQRNVLGRGGDVVRREAETTAAWLRSASDAQYAVLGSAVRARTKDERAAAATKIDALATEAAAIWSQPQAKAKLAALDARAQAEGADMFPNASSVRKAADHSQASMDKLKAALGK